MAFTTSKRSDNRTPERLHRFLIDRGISLKHLASREQLMMTVEKAYDIEPPAREALEGLISKRESLLDSERLLEQMQERGLEVDGTTMEKLRDTLGDVEVRIYLINKRQEVLDFIQWIKESMWPELFGRSFQADPTRKSFTDLPREIRDLCYRFAFEDFDVSEGIYYDPMWDRLRPSGFSRRKEFYSVTGALLRFGTLNVLIRKEARATFWSMTALSITVTMNRFDHTEYWQSCAPHYMGIVERCLRGIGDSGCFGLKVLRIDATRGYLDRGIVPQDITETGHATFKMVSRMLLECTSLTTLQLTISEHYLLRKDLTALENFFLYGEQLQSSGLQSFQKTLQALPMLQNATIDVPCVECDKGEDLNAWDNITPFIRFAFTDERRYKLWVAIKPILENTTLQLEHGRVRVDLNTGGMGFEGLWIEGDESIEETVALYTQIVPGDFERWFRTQSLL